MSRCEDYPCCGHENGGCPNSDGTFNCASCGKKLPKNSRSSLCNKCLRRLEKRIYNDDIDHDHSMDY
jgi:predicted amidophosphoribosyltransferase